MSDAGDFATWLVDTRAALRGERAADVPCGSCTACCTASQFIHVGPDEVDTLEHIPDQLLFPAPGLPQGHVLLGYDEHGRCPMLIDNRCSIYEQRPRTCRTYDCRVFVAADVDPLDDGVAKTLVAQQVRQWQFSFADDADRVQLDAVRAAAASLRDQGGTGAAGPLTATQRAVRAIEQHDASRPAASARGEVSRQDDRE